MAPIVKKAIEAVDRIHQDTSVPAGQTRSRFVEIRDHVSVLIEALDEDLGDDDDGGVKE